MMPATRAERSAKGVLRMLHHARKENEKNKRRVMAALTLLRVRGDAADEMRRKPAEEKVVALRN